MDMFQRRAKVYQITNNSTEHVFVGSTTSPLYKRLYRIKHDVDRGVDSILCNLMRKLGKDKFKIELIEEGVYSSTDLLKARVSFYMREKGASPSPKETREIGAQTDYEADSSSASAPESYYMSDEEQEAEEVPADLPNYDLTSFKCKEA